MPKTPHLEDLRRPRDLRCLIPLIWLLSMLRTSSSVLLTLPLTESLDRKLVSAVCTHDLTPSFSHCLQLAVITDRCNVVRLVSWPASPLGFSLFITKDQYRLVRHVSHLNNTFLQDKVPQVFCAFIPSNNHRKETCKDRKQRLHLGWRELWFWGISP